MCHSQLFEKWNQWKREIHGGIAWMHRVRCIYARLLEIVSSNGEIDKTNALVWWMFINYGYSAILNLRRLTEKRRGNSNTISLHRLIDSMLRNPDTKTNTGLLQEQLQRVEATEKRIKAFADKVIAHHDADRQDYDLRIEFKEVDDLADEVIDIYGRLDVELQRIRLKSLKPRPPSFPRTDASWESVLRIPWIRSDT